MSNDENLLTSYPLSFRARRSRSRRAGAPSGRRGFRLPPRARRDAAERGARALSPPVLPQPLAPGVEHKTGTRRAAQAARRRIRHDPTPRYIYGALLHTRQPDAPFFGGSPGALLSS